MITIQQRLRKALERPHLIRDRSIAVNPTLLSDALAEIERLSNAEPPTDTSASSSLWQPIESAPIERAVVIWRPSSLRDDNMFIATLYDGRWECEDGKNYYGLRGEYPTHWLPLPEPPVAGEAGGGSAHKTNPEETDNETG